MIMWIVAHAMDAAAADDFHATREYLALLTASLEQSALDNNLGIAYLLSLMEEPPQQLFAERMQPLSATGRPFAPLVPTSLGGSGFKLHKGVGGIDHQKSRAEASCLQSSSTKAGQSRQVSKEAKSRGRKSRILSGANSRQCSSEFKDAAGLKITDGPPDVEDTSYVFCEGPSTLQRDVPLRGFQAS